MLNGYNTPNQIPASNIPHYQRKATLYLLKPRRVIDHFKRPLVCNFTHDYADRLYDTVSASLANNHGPSAAERFAKSPEALTSVLPSSNEGIPLATSHYSSLWTFILIVDNDIPDGSNFVSQSSQRMMYSGICFDEPINTLNFGNEKTVNEGCSMIATHSTMLGQTPVIGATTYGSGTRLDVLGDIDIVPGTVMGALTPTPLFGNRPGDIRDSTIVDEEDFSINMSAGDRDVLSNKPDNVLMSSKLGSPTQFNKQMVSAIIDGFETMASNSFQGGFGDPMMPSDMDITMDGDIRMSSLNNSVVPAIDANMQDTIYDPHGGINVKEPFHLGMILQRYHPDIIDFEPEDIHNIDAIPQHYSSHQTIFSSLISSVVVSVMANVGLADLSFTYDSYVDAYEIHFANGYTNLSEHERSSRVLAAQRVLKDNLFSVIDAAVGSKFQAMITATIFGDTDVKLNLYDYGSTSLPNEVYRHHNFLGGIGNQLVADVNTLNHNAVSMGGVVNTLTANL